MTAKKTIGAVVVVFLIFYAITSPDHAANIFHSTWHGVVYVAHGISGFFDKLGS